MFLIQILGRKIKDFGFVFNNGQAVSTVALFFALKSFTIQLTEMANFQTFIDAVQAYCEKETISFNPIAQKRKTPEANFLPLLDFYKAFDLFRAKHNLMETVGAITMLSCVDDVSNIVWSSGKTQEQWRAIIQDLSMLVISLFRIDETIHDNNHPAGVL